MNRLGQIVDRSRNVIDFFACTLLIGFVSILLMFVLLLVACFVGAWIIPILWAVKFDAWWLLLEIPIFASYYIIYSKAKIRNEKDTSQTSAELSTE